MEIRRVGSQASIQGPAEWFTGTVRIDPLFLQANAPSRVTDAGVTFEPGAPGARTAKSWRPNLRKLKSLENGRLRPSWQHTTLVRILVQAQSVAPENRLCQRISR